MNVISASDGLPPGFAEPVLDAQRVFRAALWAMAHPGSVVDLALKLSAPDPLDAATAALALTLADYETQVWLDPVADTAAIRRYLRFHCGCPLTTDADMAAFAIVAAPAARPPLSAFSTGCEQYPDRSATVILQVPSLSGGPQWTLHGPGIRGMAYLAVAGLPVDFGHWVVANHALFPRGVDLFFACGSRLAALPRSTEVEVPACTSR